MIHTKLFRQAFSVKVEPTVDDYLEYARILAAAIVNPRFQRSLLVDPGTALRNGYQGEPFRLSENGWTWLRSIRADSLCELASRLVPTYTAAPQSPPAYLAQPPGTLER